MKIAIDTQILLRNHARRTVLGTAELCRVDVVIPETALIMAKVHYPAVCQSYVRNTLEWRDDNTGTQTSEEEMGLLVHDATQRLGIGFGRWLEEEALRNDGAFTKAPRNRRAQGLAMELSNAGVVVDPKDTRWKVGEDPYVIAEALEAGAHWLASDNFQTLKPDIMEIWLDEAQDKGRYPNVPRPFILSSEQALRKMVAHTNQWHKADHEKVRRAIVHAVSTPRDPNRTLNERIGVLRRFAKELAQCGMVRTGQEIDRWARRTSTRHTRGETTEVEQELEELTQWVQAGHVGRTREAEERRMRAEGLVERRANREHTTPRARRTGGMER